jgi:dolichyl-diphosphooligosaccharide--protein glycosyltransferase
MKTEKILFSMGDFDFKLSHILVIFVLSISFTTSFLLRSLPSEYGWELHEFDPFFNYRATEFLINNGIEKYFEWNDSLSWYPYGRDISSNSQIMLHITTAVTYWIFGGNGDLYGYTIILPVIFGSLTCIVIFALTRVISGTTVGLFSSLFFAISLPILVRGQIGWFKSEPLGLFVGLLATYFLLSGIKSKNSTSYLRVITGGIFTVFGLSAWGGNLFFLIPIGILFCLLPFVRHDQNFLLKIIPLYTATVIFSAFVFEDVSTGSLFNFLGSLLILSTLILVIVIIVQKISTRKNRNGALALLSMIILICTIILVAENSNSLVLPAHRYLNAIFPLLTTTDPLTDSVSEHSTLELPQSFVFHSVLMIFASLGIWFIITKNKKFNIISNDMKIYALALGMFSVYIGSAFMRLEVFTSIGIILLSSIGVVILIKSSLFANKKNIISTFILTPLILSMLMVPLFLPVDANVIHISSNTPPTIKNGGSNFNISSNDWRESLEWIKNNTPEESVIGSWWDYGYWIQTIANRTTLADNSTVIDHRIKTIAKIFFETPDDAWKSLMKMETDYFIIFVAAEKLSFQTSEFEDLFLVHGGGDESKKYWFAKIAGVEMNEYFHEDNFSGKNNFWSNTFLGKIIPYQLYGYANPETNQFSTEFYPGWIALYTKQNKFLDNNEPFHLVYSSSSYDSPIDNISIGVFVYEINDDYATISEEWDNPVIEYTK